MAEAGPPSDGWDDAKARDAALSLMDQETLARAITHRGDPLRERRLFRRLHAGEAIVIGVFGASVAQNAGCLDQGSRRCMRYRGAKPAGIKWGSPTYRPFKGWAVRLLDHINTSYPAAHRINNSGLDAIPVSAAVDCLFSYLPSKMDVAILEFGSMAIWNAASPWAIEAAVRQFAALPSPPVLLLLSVHNWCEGVRDVLSDGSKYRDSWDKVENETIRICRAYGATCISQKRALLPHVMTKRLEKSHIAGKDCMHPINAPLGVDTISLMLNVGWFAMARRRYWATAPHHTLATTDPPTSTALPAPIWPRNARPSMSRCYAFTTPAAKWIAEVGLRVRPIRWSTSWCPLGEGIAPTISTSDCQTPAALNSTRMTTCPPKLDRDQKAYTSLMVNPPRHFFFCHYSLSARARKLSFGVVALVPGATLRFADQAGGEHARQTVLLSYLTSYEGMGIATLRCQQCRCAAREIDAHRPASQSSVYEQVSVSVSDANVDGCEVVLQLLARTTSGSTKFKVRFVTFRAQGEGEPVSE